MRHPMEYLGRASGPAPSALSVSAETIDYPNARHVRELGGSYPQLRGTKRYNLVVFGPGGGSAGCRPIIHQSPSLLEEIAAPIGRLDTVWDGVRQGHFHDVIRVGCGLCRPIPERRTKAMHRRAGTQLRERVGHCVLI